MNIYQKITLGLSTVLLSGTAAADNFVMTSPADYRSYKSSQGEAVSVGILWGRTGSSIRASLDNRINGYGCQIMAIKCIG